MITIYGKESCAYCNMAKTLCEQKGVEYEYLMLKEDYTPPQFFEKFPSERTFPQIVVEDKNIGGYNELMEYFENE